MQYLRTLLRYLFPATCVLCNVVSSASTKDLCLACENDLPRLRGCCPQCGYLLSMNHDLSKCGWCLRYQPPFDATFALWRYQQPVVQLITGLKFNKQLKYARLMGELMADYLAAQIVEGYQPPECIIPIPLHHIRLQERGFNQALEIARPIAKRLKIPLDITSCSRIKATQAQSSIPAKRRRNNVKDAFRVDKEFAKRHVAIIDDVMTTGHTVAELSKQLRRRGALHIDIWCCARTVQAK